MVNGLLVFRSIHKTHTSCATNGATHTHPHKNQIPCAKFYEKYCTTGSSIECTSYFKVVARCPSMHSEHLHHRDYVLCPSPQTMGIHTQQNTTEHNLSPKNKRTNTKHRHLSNENHIPPQPSRRREINVDLNRGVYLCDERLIKDSEHHHHYNYHHYSCHHETSPTTRGTTTRAKKDNNKNHQLDLSFHWAYVHFEKKLILSCCFFFFARFYINQHILVAIIKHTIIHIRKYSLVISLSITFVFELLSCVYVQVGAQVTTRLRRREKG